MKNPEKKLICPKCKEQDLDYVHEETKARGCSRCKGIWLEFQEERQLLLTQMAPFTLDEVRRLRDKFQPLGKIETIAYYPCPECRQLMQRKNWGSHSGVIVDKCKAHGTWYDEHELEKIMEYVALGGVELEKLRFAEKGLTRLESELTQKSLRLDKRIDSAYRRARIFSLLGF